MDSIVLKGVTGPNYQELQQQVGILKDFKRCKVKGAEYPGIMGSVGDQVEGIVVTGITSQALVLLDDFEDDDYERKNVIIDLGNGEQTNALAYVAGPAMLLEDEEWKLRDWKRNHRVQFLKKLESGLKVY